MGRALAELEKASAFIEEAFLPCPLLEDCLLGWLLFRDALLAGVAALEVSWAGVGVEEAAGWAAGVGLFAPAAIFAQFEVGVVLDRLGEDAADAPLAPGPPFALLLPLVELAAVEGVAAPDLVLLAVAEADLLLEGDPVCAFPEGVLLI